MSWVSSAGKFNQAEKLHEGDEEFTNDFPSALEGLADSLDNSRLYHCSPGWVREDDDSRMQWLPADDFALFLSIWTEFIMGKCSATLQRRIMSKNYYKKNLYFNRITYCKMTDKSCANNKAKCYNRLWHSFTLSLFSCTRCLLNSTLHVTLLLIGCYLFEACLL